MQFTELPHNNCVGETDGTVSCGAGTAFGSWERGWELCKAAALSHLAIPLSINRGALLRT